MAPNLIQTGANSGHAFKQLVAVSSNLNVLSVVALLAVSIKGRKMSGATLKGKNIVIMLRALKNSIKSARSSSLQCILFTTKLQGQRLK